MISAPTRSRESRLWCCRAACPQAAVNIRKCIGRRGGMWASRPTIWQGVRCAGRCRHRPLQGLGKASINGCRGRRLRRPARSAFVSSPLRLPFGQPPPPEGKTLPCGERCHAENDREGGGSRQGDGAPRPKKNFQKNIPLLSVSGQQGGLLRLWVRGWNETAQTRKRGILVCAVNKARKGLIL